MLDLEELPVLQPILVNILGEVVQQKWIDEVHDVLHVVGLYELGVWLDPAMLVQALREQDHKHKELVEEGRVELPSVDFDQELAEDVVAGVLVQVLLLIILGFGLFVVGVDDVEVRTRAQLLQLAGSLALDISDIVAEVVDDVPGVIIGLALIVVNFLGAGTASLGSALRLRLYDFPRRLR